MAQAGVILQELLAKEPRLQAFASLAQHERSLLVEELWDGSKAALLAWLSTQLQRDIVVISAGTEDALYQSVNFFTPSVLEFPSWETLPGEEIAPSLDLVGRRLETLHALLEKKAAQIVFAPLQAALQKLPSPQTLKPLIHTWHKGDSLCFSTLPDTLISLGYKRASVVVDKGEFALRGGIIDLFPVSSPTPYRLEFFGDTLEEIRAFDPISQKSIHKVDALFLAPAVEPSSHSASVLDYLGKDVIVVFNDLLALEDRFVALKQLGADFSLQELFARAPYTLLFAQQKVEALSKVHIEEKKGRAFYSGKEPLQPLSFELADVALNTKRWHSPFIRVADFFSCSDNYAAATSEEILQGVQRHVGGTLSLHCVYASEAEKETFLAELPQKTHYHCGNLSSGFCLEEAGLALLPLAELNHRFRPRVQKWRTTTSTPPSDFHELKGGDLVVHYHQGIGIYQGVERRANHLGVESEFLVLQYAEEGKLFVPASHSHLVSRYIGAHEEAPPLNIIGSKRWQKTKSAAQTAIIGYADQLLRMHAQREVHGGFALPPDSKEMRLFETDFPFAETPDQKNAIETIKEELQSTKAMDRLLCGDVGYGKTEVALRAAFKHIVDGKRQVALLVPTTVLALQHYETSCARMGSSVRVGIVSRFHSLKENQETLRKVHQGEIDLLIGTHRMLSKDVHFKELGLLIIDEEQRFGVRAKEYLKHLKTGVDCLTLSATPIPRTLYLSLVGAKEISMINTPPQDRLPIKSIIAQREAPLIKNALLRELSRGGQAFFIHNRIESIFRVAHELQLLLPEARIVTGHGQMSSDELDAVFHSFKTAQADILVATTLIENGIDIPNANTILIDRADTFGLADLYQMRGRVGRWNRPAFAYFLIPAFDRLSDLSRKRLCALTESSGFGAGMKIAMRDLEIRGAGDILGTSQSGQICSIGFHLYCKLLKKTVDALKAGKSPSFVETKMEFSFDASIPESYIGESSLRMEIYHRFGEATSLQEIEALSGELKDRFGSPPRPLLWLIHLTRLRLFASSHHFTLLKFEKLTFTAERQLKDRLEKKVLTLPRTQDPAAFEGQVQSLLIESFLGSSYK